MNHVNVSIVVPLHHLKTLAGVKTEVDSIFAINVEFILLVHINYLPMQISTHQQAILTIEVFERVYVNLLESIFN